MNPLEPQDPLWKLLGKSREARVRPNFAQNVVREARNTPQERGWLAGLKRWWGEAESVLPAGRLIALAAVVLVGGLAWVKWAEDGAAKAEVAVAAPLVETARMTEAPLVPEVETQLESLDYLDELLALEDTSALTDREIAYLLY